jgi:hypothetical protein
MSRVLSRISLVAVAMTLLSSPALAQLPPVTDEQAAMGALVSAVGLEPGEVALVRGDSAQVRVVLQDKDGNPVEGALAFMFSPNTAVVGPQVGRQRSDGTFQFLATGPGSTSQIIVVRVNDDNGNFRGMAGIRQIGTLDVMVSDWPVSRLDMDDVAYTPYAGTTYKLSARAMTDHDTEHSTAKVVWSTETPEVATVTSGGVLSLLKNGDARLTARTGDLVTPYEFEVIKNPIRSLTISPSTVTTRTGDVVRFDVQALDKKGQPIERMALSYSVFGIDSTGGEIFEDGSFVADKPGAFRAVVTTGGLVAEAIVEADKRPEATPVEVVGRGAVAHVTTSDIWVFTGLDGRDYAYTGTHSTGGGQRMFVWDVTNPEAPELTDSVVVDARVVNDVKVNDAATWAVITREGASDRKNGLVVLDLADPAHPTVVSELTEGMTSGMHNTWIIGNIVYGINDGKNAMDIVDMADPANPQHVGSWELRPGEEDKSLHDVWGDDIGYLYLSYWDDGLVILDAGAGTHDGTPTAPTFVSSIAYAMGNTHVAWRERNYVFVGDEIFGCTECTNGPRGYIHVIDVADIDNPVEVAKFEVPEAGAHNIWVQDGLLYIAYYQGGLRIVDVSGDLRGDLYAQGRQVGWYVTGGEEDESVVPNSPLAWGPQPFKGNIFLSDMNSGLWVLKHDRPEALTP